MGKEELFSQIQKTGKNAQKSNILAARIIAETVRSTLGPKGMDKILLDEKNNIIITNDGATIVTELASDHPVARMITEIALAQEEQVGDGTTTAVLLAGELLKKAEGLLEQKIHPTIINKGYQLASAAALDALKKAAIRFDFDAKNIQAIAKTAMTGKGAESASGTLIPLLLQAADAVDSLDISVITQPGLNVDHSEFIDGVMLSKQKAHVQMPSEIIGAKIALVTCPLELNRGGASVSIQTPEQLQAFMDKEESVLKDLVDKIKQSGANVVCTNKGIDELAQHYLAQEGIYGLRRVPTSEMQIISRSTGATILSTISDLTSSSLGKCAKVYGKSVFESPYTVFSGISSHGTLLIAGATQQVADEMSRAIDDAIGDLRVFKSSGYIVGGAGSIDMQLSLAVRELAKRVEGKEQLAIEAFASALEVVPITLAENAGLDPVELLTRMRADSSKGINVVSGILEDPIAAGIIEPLQIKEHAIRSATEVAVMILRIDDVIFTGSYQPGPQNPQNQVPPQ